MTELLTPLEFDFLWEAVVGREHPYPLRVHSHGATLTERSALRARTLTELADRGILGHQDQVRSRAAELLQVIADYEISVDSMQITAVGAHPLLAIAAAGRGQGALVVQDDRGFRFSEIPVDGLASAIVGLLPTAARGVEKSITLPATEVTSFASAGESAITHSSRQEDRRVLALLNAQPRLRGGQIGINLRDSLGGGVRRPVLSWFDTDSGRYLTQASNSRQGEKWITIAPTDTPSLRHRIGEMLRR